MSDLISRQAAIEAMMRLQKEDEEVYGVIPGGFEGERAAEALSKLPSAEPEQQKWIPVTERLPEDYEPVLCWYEYFRYGDYNRMWQDYGIGYYASEYDMWGGDGIQGHKARVIAWMQLPAPYKEMEHDSDKAAT